MNITYFNGVAMSETMIEDISTETIVNNGESLLESISFETSEDFFKVFQTDHLGNL